MSTETVLTDEQIIEILDKSRGNTDGMGKAIEVSRAIEQAVLQSPEIQALRRRVEDLEKIVAECRDAMPIPSVGSKAEKCWPDAMSDAGGVPGFVKASIEALRKDAEAFRLMVSFRLTVKVDEVCSDVEVFHLGECLAWPPAHHCENDEEVAAVAREAIQKAVATLREQS